MKEDIAQKLWGYGKSKEYWDYPWDWIIPVERLYDRKTGMKMIKGKYWTDVLAFIRRYILRKEPVFWMKPSYPLTRTKDGNWIKK